MLTEGSREIDGVVLGRSIEIELGRALCVGIVLKDGILLADGIILGNLVGVCTDKDGCAESGGPEDTEGRLDGTDVCSKMTASTTMLESLIVSRNAAWNRAVLLNAAIWIGTAWLVSEPSLNCKTAPNAIESAIPVGLLLNVG